MTQGEVMNMQNIMLIDEHWEGGYWDECEESFWEERCEEEEEDELV